MKPFIQLETTICARDEDGRIWKELFVAPYRWGVWVDSKEKQEQTFSTSFGDITITIEAKSKPLAP